MEPSDPTTWSANWAWGVPLTVLTLLIHIGALGWAYENAIQIKNRSLRESYLGFLVTIVIASMLSVFLHAIESGIWAAAFWWLGAQPDYHSAMLFSLNALTTYGHSDKDLPMHWRLLGAIEALDGMMLFGLTTAFLFAIIEKVRPRGGLQQRTGSRSPVGPRGR
jgi:hypothetical protein